MKTNLHPRSIEIITMSTLERAVELACAQDAADVNVVKGIHAELYEYVVGFVTEEKDDSTWAENYVKDEFNGTVENGGGQQQQRSQSRSQSNGGGQRSGGRSPIKVYGRLPHPDGEKNDRGEVKKLGNPDWLEAAMLADGVKEVWDNRKDHPAFGGPAANRKRPWFREKDPVDDDNAKAYWPPRDSDQAAADYVHPWFANRSNSGGGRGYDDEEPF